MRDFKTSKNLSAVGSILIWTPLACIIGYILLYIGMKGLSEYYKNDRILRDFTAGLVFGIIGSIVFSISLITAFFGDVVGIMSIAGMAFTGHYGVTAFIMAYVWATVPLVVGAVFLLLQALRFKKGFDALAKHSGVNMFRTTGALMIISAILSIIYVGIIFLAIAHILLAVACFSLKTNPTLPSCSYTPHYTVQPHEPYQQQTLNLTST
jgi:uncharacterized membrane protein